MLLGEVERGGVRPGAESPPGENGSARGVRGGEEGEYELEDAVGEVAEPVLATAASCSVAVSGHRASPCLVDSGLIKEGRAVAATNTAAVGFLHAGDAGGKM